MPHKDPEVRKAYARAYYQQNQTKIIARARAHQVAHKEDRAAYLKAYTAENPETLRTYHREWSAKNRDKLLRKSREYEASNRETIKTKKAKKYQANLVEERQKRRAYYAANAAAGKAQALLWAKAHPEQHRAIQQRRRARKLGATRNDFTKQQWLALQEAFEHRCAYCGKRAKGQLTQDHLTPLSKDGDHTLSNIVPACRSCNAKKSNNDVLVPVQPLLLLA